MNFYAFDPFPARGVSAPPPSAEPDVGIAVSFPAAPAALCDAFRSAVERVAAAAQIDAPRVVCMPGAGFLRANPNGTIDVDPVYLAEVVSVVLPEDRFAAVLGCAAHEVAHHAIPGSFLASRDSVATEREADAFAGDLLRKLGVSTKPFKLCLLHHPPSPDHPTPIDRFRAIGRPDLSIGGAADT